jgi:hypothetical protein
MRTLIGGTMLGSPGFVLLVGEGDVTFSVCGRRFAELHLDDSLALACDASIAPVLFAT